MAEQEKQAQAQPPSSTPSSSPSGKGKGPKRGPGLAPIAGEQATDDRPAERRPGTPEHLGSDRPYEGGESPFVEGDPDARDR